MKNPIRIYLVEDELLVAKDLAEMLAGLGYLVVGTAAAKATALHQVPLLQPDLLLVDVRLQGEGDGIELVARLKGQRKYPVIYITSLHDPATIARAKATRPDGYLVKPFTTEDVYAATEMALSHYAEEEPDTTSPEAHDPGRLPPYRLKVLDAYIAANLEEPLTLAQLAAQVEMNLYYFARLFKASTGKSPHQYVLEKRLERARQLLLETGESVIQIAFATGFKEPSHFTKVFSRHVGATPTQYRNRFRWQKAQE